jgi:hypothetical protein
MNVREHQRRLAFLTLKANLGSITPDERAELQRLSLCRITETTGGTVLIESHPLRPEDWSEYAKRTKDELSKIHWNT